MPDGGRRAGILVIWNAGARGASRDPALRERLEREPGLVLRVSASRLQARALASAAAARGVPLVLAAGGDGTVAAVAGGLAGKRGRTRLGILPLGTANDVARTLGIPEDPVEALSVQRTAGVRRLDVLDLRHDGRRRIVVNAVAAGNGAVVTRGASRGAKDRWGHWSYLRSAASVLSAMRRWDATLRIDDEPARVMRLLSFAVANGPAAAGGFVIAPGADPFDGLFDVVALDDAPAREIAAVMVRLFVGKLVEGDHLLRRPGRHVRLSCAEAIPLSADGDVLPPARRIDVRLMKGALRVVTTPR